MKNSRLIMVPKNDETRDPTGLYTAIISPARLTPRCHTPLPSVLDFPENHLRYFDNKGACL